MFVLPVAYVEYSWRDFSFSKSSGSSRVSLTRAFAKPSLSTPSAVGALRPPNPTSANSFCSTGAYALIQDLAFLRFKLVPIRWIATRTRIKPRITPSCLKSLKEYRSWTLYHFVYGAVGPLVGRAVRPA